MLDPATTLTWAHPSRHDRLRVLGLRILVSGIVLMLTQIGMAQAFPLLDATNADQVPQGTELATPDVNDLQHQLRLVNGLSAPAGGGWTFIPRVDLQEELTDNALLQHSPRQGDLITFISPGIGIAGDLPRMQLTFDFAPTLALYARNSQLNSLTEQMNGLGSITLVPDLAYVDIRALAGVRSQFGGYGGAGSIGAPAGAAATVQTATPILAGNGQGLSRNDEVQVSSFAISPYLVHRFGDWGTGKLGYSLGVSESDAVTGFATSPFPTGGANAQTLVSNEEIAHFATGDFMQYFQDSFDVDLQQNQTTTGASAFYNNFGAPVQNNQNSTSTRVIVSDQITYRVNRSLSVFALGGHEDISYTGFGNQSIHDLIWSFGGTYAPNADSSLTLSYGHRDGFDSFSANGYYAVSPRTLLTVSYGTTLGTQLEYIQNQLNLASTNGTGTLVNAQTGGGQLFGATNALAVEGGVFRTTTLVAGSQTTLDRDIITVNLLLARQESSGQANSFTTQSKTVSLGWLHQLNPTMTFSAGISYSIQDQSNDLASAFNPGNSTSILASLALGWQISDTVGASLRYSFLERQSAVAAYDVYQNAIIFGISKRF